MTNTEPYGEPPTFTGSTIQLSPSFAGFAHSEPAVRHDDVIVVKVETGELLTAEEIKLLFRQTRRDMKKFFPTNRIVVVSRSTEIQVLR